MDTSKSQAQNQDDQSDFLKLSIDDQVNLIHQALEPEVYPALQMDGGGMEIMDIEDTNVLIRYHGACGNCAIGETGTLGFIEHTLRSQVDERLNVVIV